MGAARHAESHRPTGALSAKAVEHLNLASIVGENLRQLVDRAQAVGRVTQDDMKGLRQATSAWYPAWPQTQCSSA